MLTKAAACNEMFGDAPLRQVCDRLARHGFAGVEIAPFTLGPDPARLERHAIAECRAALRDSGIRFAGMHWLLAKPAGLDIASPDSAVRARTIDHMRRLFDIAGELGGGAFVLGSPNQRSSHGGDRAGAISRLKEFLAVCGKYAADRGSMLLLESLSPAQTDVVNTLEEAVALVREAGAPGLSSMFDFHNCASEPVPWETLVARNLPYIRHVHLNERDGSWPRPGSAGFVPAFRALRAGGYSGWVSLEIFSVPADPDLVLRQTAEFLEEVEKTIAGLSAAAGQAKEN